MEFNGAVLVDNQKIENALENCSLLRLEYDLEISRCQEKLASQIGDLSWWDHIMCEGRRKKWEKVYLRKYNGYISSVFYDDWIYNFWKIGLVSEESYKKFEDMGENYYYYIKYFRPLGSLVKAGTPVYLNPEQAGFVNTFYKKGVNL